MYDKNKKKIHTLIQQATKDLQGDFAEPLPEPVEEPAGEPVEITETDKQFNTRVRKESRHQAYNGLVQNYADAGFDRAECIAKARAHFPPLTDEEKEQLDKERKREKQEKDRKSGKRRRDAQAAQKANNLAFFIEYDEPDPDGVTSTLETIDWVSACIRRANKAKKLGETAFLGRPPSEEALGQLLWACENNVNQGDFWKSIWGKSKLTKENLTTENRRSDDGRSQIELARRFRAQVPDNVDYVGQYPVPEEARRFPGPDSYRPEEEPEEAGAVPHGGGE